MTQTIFLMNGPNLNLLGKREPQIYGHETLDDIARDCTALAGTFGLNLRAMQSNWEGQLIDWIHDAREQAAGIILNPGAFTHTSIAILDALNTYKGPVIEVHISQVHKREAFRHHSYVSHRADAVMAGFGVHGYQLAVRHMARLLAA